MADTTTKELILKVKTVDDATATVEMIRAKTERELAAAQKAAEKMAREQAKVAADLERSAVKKQQGIAKAVGFGGALGDGALDGAGRIAIAGGAALAAAAIQKVVEQTAKLRAEFAAGKIDSVQLFDGIVRSVPVLGDAYSVVRDIKEIATGEQAAFDKRMKDEQRLNDIYFERKKFLQEMAAAIEEQAIRARDLSRQNAVNGLVPEALRPGASARVDKDRELAAFDRKAKAEADKLAEKYAPTIDDLRGKVEQRTKREGPAAAGQITVEQAKLNDEEKKLAADRADLFKSQAAERAAVEQAANLKIGEADKRLADERARLAKETADRIRDITLKTEIDGLTAMGEARKAKLLQIFDEERKLRETAAAKAAERASKGDWLGALTDLARENAAVRTQRDQQMRAEIGTLLKDRAKAFFAADPDKAAGGVLDGLVGQFQRAMFGGTGKNLRDVPGAPAALQRTQAVESGGTGIGLALAEQARAQQVNPVVKAVERAAKEQADRDKRAEERARKNDAAVSALADFFRRAKVVRR